MERQKITAINHYDVFPFNSGGSLAVRGFEKGLSTWFDINLITLVGNPCYFDEIKISDHITLYPILIPEELLDRQSAFYEEYGMDENTLFDASIAIMRWYHECPEIIEKVRMIARDSIAMMAEHVYTWKIIKTACPDKLAFYRAHNVEYDFKVGTYRLIDSPKDLLQETYDFEKKCCLEADHIFTVSQIEADRFMELYQFPESMRDKFTDIHLGYDADKKKLVLPSARERISGQYEFYGFFISSDMPSALDAARVCIEVAKKYQIIKIIIAGRICRLLNVEKDLPDNVEIAGLISEDDKDFYLSHCDFAMNPVESGAGVNVKMFEYYAYGIPVISTPHGARGTGLKNKIEGIIADKSHYCDAVWDFCNMPIDKKDEMAKNAFDILEREYSWKSIARKAAEEIRKERGIDYKQYEVSDSETAIRIVRLDEPYIPKKKFFIRCAGINGKKCLEYMRFQGHEPEAFIEKSAEKEGSTIDGVNVISLDRFLELPDDSEVIVAVFKWIPVVSELLKMGISEDRIAVSWSNTGHDIFHLSDMSGTIPRYHDVKKFKNLILDYEEKK